MQDRMARIAECPECGGPGPAWRHITCRLDALERAVRELKRQLAAKD